MTTAGKLTEVRPGVWKCRVYVGTIDGREVVRSRTFKASSRRAAEREAEAIRTQLRNDRAVKAARSAHLAGLVDEWFEIQQSKCSPTTIYRITPIVTRIKDRLGHIRVDELGPRDIERFYAWLRTTPQPAHRNHRGPKKPLSESTVHHHHRVLSAVLNMGERWGKVTASPARKVDPPKRGTARVEPPTTEQIGAVVNLCPDTWGPVFAFAARTGMRRGEICAARWANLTPAGLTVVGAIVKDGDRLVEKTTKTRKPRTVELDAETRVMLEAVRVKLEHEAETRGKKLAGAAYLFPDMTADATGRRPLHPDHLSSAWRAYADRAGVTARFHDLRHHAATYYLARGVAVNDVANMLGHAQASTTVNVYGHAGRNTGIAALMAGAAPLPKPAVSS